MKEKLKPCPFCKSRDIELEKSTVPHSYVLGWQVGCHTGYYHESCPGYITASQFYKSKKQAIRTWNRRPKK